jgi:hypothetical protein
MANKTTKNALRHWAIVGVFLFTLSLLGCGSAGGGGTSTSTASTKLSSTSLSASLSASLLQAMGLQAALSSSCGSSAVNCVTPDNVTGKVYYSGIMVGDISGYSVGPIVGTVVDPSTITSFDPATFLDFDLNQQLAVAGSFQCCGGTAFPVDENAVAQRIESYFPYVDVVFTLTTDDGVAEAVAGTHTVRVVYGDIDGTEMQKGDMLYKGASDTDFFWCTVADDCTHATRPASPLQNATVANYTGTSDGLGNQTIPTFSIQLADATSKISMTETEVKANNWTFTIDFSLANGIIFSEDLTTKTSIAEMVQVFDLAAQPGQNDGGFTATLSATKTAKTEEELAAEAAAEAALEDTDPDA